MSDEPKPSGSFCGRSQDEVLTLIVAPAAHICEGCVALCVDVLKERRVWPWPVRLFRATKRVLLWLLIVLIAAGVLVLWLKHQLAIDTCFDHGGVWSYARNVCEGERTQSAGASN